MPEPKINKVCQHCDSDEVVKDAWVEWDIDTQAYVLSQIFDASYCNGCESSSDYLIEDQPIKDERTHPEADDDDERRKLAAEHAVDDGKMP